MRFLYSIWPGCKFVLASILHKYRQTQVQYTPAKTTDLAIYIYIYIYMECDAFLFHIRLIHIINIIVIKIRKTKPMGILLEDGKIQVGWLKLGLINSQNKHFLDIMVKIIVWLY